VNQVKKPDEFEIISRFFAPLAENAPGAFGLTDDGAVLSPEKGADIVVTTDKLVAGVHFPIDESPDLIASRLLAVNLSDLAAMGAKPWAYTLSIALPENWDIQWLDSFVGGLAGAQEAFSISLVGGDTVATPGPLTVCLTALGHIQKGQELRRSGAEQGDDIYVSGTIGDAALGLKVQKGEIPGLSEKHSTALLARFHQPIPRVQLGGRLWGLAHGVIDISDGLVADLSHICRASKCDATIDIAQVPFSEPARAAFDLDGALKETAITGGDDYELLFTAPPSSAEDIGDLSKELRLALTLIGGIGEMAGDAGSVKVVGESGKELTLIRDGYRHF